MADIFLRLVNMSITASWITLAVIIIRFVFKKAPKFLNCFLWLMVAFRLVFPFSFESILSLIPSTQTIPNDIITENSFDINTGIGFVDNQVNSYLSDHYYEGVTVPTDNGFNVIGVLSIIWLIGMAVMLIYAVLSYIKIRQKVAEAVPYMGNVLMCDNIGTPFILGLIRPKIYITSDLNETDLSYVLKHEQAHLKRRDHLWKPFGFVLLTVYWFNPVMWIAYALLCRDIELACDEKVINEMGLENKKAYSNALINCSVPRKFISACPLAFGETDMKGRIKSVLKYKKPTVITVCVAVLVCIIAGVCLMTDPMTDETGETTTAISEDDFVPKDYGVIYSADINSDGVKEDISVVEEREEEFNIVFTDADGNVVWTEYMSWTHPDWNSIHICNIDGKDYILSYNPYMSTGLGSYTYEIFTIQNGEQKTLKENRVNFSINAARFELPIEEILAFDKEITEYLQSSTLILSTLDGEPMIGPKTSEGFYDSYGFWIADTPLGEIDYENSTLRECLEKYRDNMYEYLKSENEPIYYADINSDGVKEDISVVQKSEYEYSIIFSDTNGKTIWTEDIGTDHAHSNTIHIYHDNGKDYILKYNSYISTGLGIYFYEIYSIENGQKKIVYENSVSFSTFGLNELDVDALVDFENEISSYFQSSTIMLSTIGDYIIGPVKSEGFDSERWDWVYDNEYIKIDKSAGSFREHLQEYSDYMTEYYKNNHFE